VLTLVTIAIFVLFLVTAIVLNFAARPSAPPPAGTTISEPGDDAPDPIVDPETPLEGDADSGDLPAGSGDAPAPETDPETDPETGPVDPPAEGGGEDDGTP
jgi:hypothetical protein